MFKKIDPHAITAAVTFIVGLAVTNGLITNETGKIVTGFASAAVALGFLVYGALKHKTNVQDATARASATAPTQPVPPAA